MTSISEIPSLDLDLFTDDVLTDPFPVYERIRNAGPVVYLPRYQSYAMGRYADVRAGLADWESFSSAVRRAPRNSSPRFSTRTRLMMLIPLCAIA